MRRALEKVSPRCKRNISSRIKAITPLILSLRRQHDMAGTEKARALNDWAAQQQQEHRDSNASTKLFSGLSCRPETSRPFRITEGFASLTGDLATSRKQEHFVSSTTTGRMSNTVF